MPTNEELDAYTTNSRIVSEIGERSLSVCSGIISPEIRKDSQAVEREFRSMISRKLLTEPEIMGIRNIKGYTEIFAVHFLEDKLGRVGFLVSPRSIGFIYGNFRHHTDMPYEKQFTVVTLDAFRREDLPAVTEYTITWPHIQGTDMLFGTIKGDDKKIGEFDITEKFSRNPYSKELSICVKNMYDMLVWSNIKK